MEPPRRCSICRIHNPMTACTGCVCEDYFTEATANVFVAIANRVGDEAPVRAELESRDRADAFLWIHRNLKLVAGDDVEDQDALTEKLAAAEAEVLELKQKLADSKRQIEQKQLPPKVAISSLYDPLLGHCEPAIFMIEAKVMRFKDQSTWLLTCNVCKAKVNQIQSPDVYWCGNCNAGVGVAARLGVLFEVSNESGKVWLSAFDSQAEKVVGCSADELFRIESEEGSHAFQMKLKAAVGQEFDFLIDVRPVISRRKVDQSIKVIEAFPAEVLEIPHLEDAAFSTFETVPDAKKIAELMGTFGGEPDNVHGATGIQQVDSRVRVGATTTEQVDSTALAGSPSLAASGDTLAASSSSTDSASSPPQKFRSLATLVGTGATGIQQVDSRVHVGATTTEQVDSTALVGSPSLAASGDTLAASSSSTDSASSPPQKFRSLATLVGTGATGIQQVDSSVHVGATTTEQVDSTALVAEEAAPRRGRGGNPRRRRRARGRGKFHFF